MNLIDIIQTLQATQTELTQLRSDNTALQGELASIRNAAAPKRWQVGFINQAAPAEINYVGAVDPLYFVQQLGYPTAVLAPDNQYAVIVESDTKPADFSIDVQSRDVDGNYSEPTPMVHVFSELP